MRLVLLLAALALAARAQDAPPPDLGPQGGSTPALVLGAVAVGSVAGLGAYTLVAESSGEALPTALAAGAAYGLGASVGVALAGTVFGIEGSPAGALRAGAVGAAVGAGSMALVTLTLQGGPAPVFVLSGIAGAVAPTVLALRGYDARPTLLTTPTGESVPALSLSLDL